VNRRKFLKYAGAGAAALAIAGIGGYAYLSSQKRSSQTTGTSVNSSDTSYVPPGSTTDYAEFMEWLGPVATPYSGTTLNISMELDFQPLGIQGIDTGFYAATNINDQYELKSYDLHLADISALAATHSPDYDIVNLGYEDVGSFSDLVLSPSELADQYPDITYEKIVQQDFQPISWALCSMYPPGTVQGGSTTTTSTLSDNDAIGYVPFDMSTMIQYYRQDLLEANGLSVATTWEEYTSNAKALMGTKTKFGTVCEASQEIPVVYEFMNFLPSYGGQLWNVNDGQLTSALNSDAALSALETYSGLYEYADPASITYTWDDISNDLLRSISATGIDFQGYESYMQDPNRSLVIGDIGYAPVPAGPSGSFPLFGGTGIGVSRYSKNPAAAWLWLQWATSLGAQEMSLLGYYHPFPSRMAVFNNSTVQQALETSQYDAINVLKQTFANGNLASLTPFPKWLDVIGPISYYLLESFRGAMTPQDSLSGAIQMIESWGSLTF
jgi:multiple sugar transport system substrate-binding protein